MSDLVDALIALGVQVESVDGALPITVMGSDRLLSDVSVGGSVSSQFLSALLPQFDESVFGRKVIPEAAGEPKAAAATGTPAAKTRS